MGRLGSNSGGRAAALSVLLAVAHAVLVPTPPARANVGEAYGFGARAASLAGAGAAGLGDAFSVYTNPAAMGVDAGAGRLGFSYGFLMMTPEFKPIRDVTLNNSTLGYRNSAASRGDVDTSYRATFGQTLGLTYKLTPDGREWTLGLATFFPVENLNVLDTGAVYQPEYFQYRARTQRVQLEAGLSARPADRLRVGIGYHLQFSVTARTELYLQSTSGQPSTMRFVTSQKPTGAPVASALWGDEGDDGLRLGAVVRAPVESGYTLVATTGLEAIGTLASLDANFDATSTLFYDPWIAELGARVPLGASWALRPQLDFQAWGLHRASAISIAEPRLASCDGGACSGLRFTPSSNPAFAYRNILVPRLGAEWAASDRVRLRGGYAYRPSSLAEPPTGSGNYLDPPKHVLGLGLGWGFPGILGSERGAQLDFFLGAHLLETQTIVKTAGTETGDPAETKVGAPGYQAGGFLWGGGVALSLAL